MDNILPSLLVFGHQRSIRFVVWAILELHLNSKLATRWRKLLPLRFSLLVNLFLLRRKLRLLSLSLFNFKFLMRITVCLFFNWIMRCRLDVWVVVSFDIFFLWFFEFYLFSFKLSNLNRIFVAFCNNLQFWRFYSTLLAAVGIQFVSWALVYFSTDTRILT